MFVNLEKKKNGSVVSEGSVVNQDEIWFYLTILQRSGAGD